MVCRTGIADAKNRLSQAHVRQFRQQGRSFESYVHRRCSHARSRRAARTKKQIEQPVICRRSCMTNICSIMRWSSCKLEPAALWHYFTSPWSMYANLVLSEMPCRNSWWLCYGWTDYVGNRSDSDLTGCNLATAWSQPDYAGVHVSNTEHGIASMTLQMCKCGHTPLKSSIAAGTTPEWVWSTKEGHCQQNSVAHCSVYDQICVGSWQVAWTWPTHRDCTE